MQSEKSRTGQISDSIYRLGTHTLPIYLIRGDGEAALFEVGISGTARLALAQLDEMGVPREEVTRVILSHAHSDHAAGQGILLAGLPRARLLLTEKSRGHLAKESTERLWSEEDAYTHGKQMEMGEPVSGEPGCLPLLPEPWELVSAGDSLFVGGVQVDLMHARGHVPGGLTAWLPGEGALLASDSGGYSVGHKPHFPLYFVSYREYMTTLAGYQALDPQMVGLGHQDVYVGKEAGQSLDDQAAHLEKEHQAILAAAKRSDSNHKIAREIFDRYYHEELTVFTPESILDCCGLLVKRSLQAGG